MRPPATSFARRIRAIFVGVEHCVLADRTQHDEPVDAGGDHVLELAAGRGKIDRAVLGELGRRGRKHAPPIDPHAVLPFATP
jgi:hypothetical protein